jgi:ubiquinone biosynthesis protein
VLLTEDGRLALLDSGLLGRLDDETRTMLALLLLSLAHNRAEDVASVLLSLSLTTLDSDEPSFVHELRRKLPRYHWRPLAGIRSGEALADLQRICLRYGVRLPASFALVGKTLSQADSIARTLDPGLDPIALIEEESLELMLAEVEARLEPNQLFSMLFMQLGSLSRLPRRLSQIADRLETGTLKVGIVPTDLGRTEHMLRSLGNRLGFALIVVGLLISSGLMARVNHTVALVGFLLAAVLGLYMIWRIIRTPGDL